VIDLGTGDGRFVLATAAACPDTLVIGVDANAAGMAEASRRAARPARRGGLPNACFVVAAAGVLPAELNGVADRLTIHFPWGSLLHGLLTAEPSILGGIARVTRPAAPVDVLLSVVDRDRLAGCASLDQRTVLALAARWAEQDLLLANARPANADDLEASHSSWAKRLRAGENRAAWSLRFRRRCSRPPSDG